MSGQTTFYPSKTADWHEHDFQSGHGVSPFFWPSGVVAVVMTMVAMMQGIGRDRTWRSDRLEQDKRERRSLPGPGSGSGASERMRYALMMMMITQPRSPRPVGSIRSSPIQRAGRDSSFVFVSPKLPFLEVFCVISIVVAVGTTKEMQVWWYDQIAYIAPLYYIVAERVCWRGN
ncbi:hypothetical protein QBC35DRAFT_95003 [Podospora australis]|uniref:Uncharacterized protein n=1 Tax=Podospora australis TaxID=1536484 RepID=A0AAN6WYY1_9PEZI|nr:hypothetical protein QBC35DRAFT_95003 [Podospora australis]